MRYSRILLFSVIVFAGMLIVFSSKVPVLSGLVGTTSDVAFAKNPGHGGLSGPHYNLNIIGVPKDKNPDMYGGHGHRIFVDLGTKDHGAVTKIFLIEGPEFQVLDANGTDGRAEFQLPDPFPNDPLISSYVVFARALGTPGGESYTRTCATDTATGEIVCSGEILELKRGHGQPKFQNATKELLTLCVEIEGKLQRVGLFDERLEDYYWNYDNHGLKLAQLRFYYDVSDTLIQDCK